MLQPATLSPRESPPQVHMRWPVLWHRGAALGWFPGNALGFPASSATRGSGAIPVSSDFPSGRQHPSPGPEHPYIGDPTGVNVNMLFEPVGIFHRKLWPGHLPKSRQNRNKGIPPGKERVTNHPRDPAFYISMNRGDTRPPGMKIFYCHKKLVICLQACGRITRHETASR